ncbi:hypothetical protein ACQJBY_011162 [Aegilops geniculata]
MLAREVATSSSPVSSVKSSVRHRPLGEPTVLVIAKFVPTLSAVESVNSVQNQDFSDATSFAEINSPMLLIDDASTLKKKQACSQEMHDALTSGNIRTTDGWKKLLSKSPLSDN